MGLRKQEHRQTKRSTIAATCEKGLKKEKEEEEEEGGRRKVRNRKVARGKGAKGERATMTTLVVGWLEARRWREGYWGCNVFAWTSERVRVTSMEPSRALNSCLQVERANNLIIKKPPLDAFMIQSNAATPQWHCSVQRVQYSICTDSTLLVVKF